MLIALFTMLILGGGDSGILNFIADTQDTVKVVMEKDDRQKGALSTLKAMKKRVSAHNKILKRTSADLDKALSTDADIDAIWEAYFKQWDAYNNEMLDLRFQFRDQLMCIDKPGVNEIGYSGFFKIFKSFFMPGFININSN